MNQDRFKLPGLETRRVWTVQFWVTRGPCPLSASPGTIEARLKTAVKEDLFWAAAGRAAWPRGSVRQGWGALRAPNVFSPLFRRASWW